MTTKNSAIFLIAFLLASCDSNINYIQPSQPLVTNYVQSQPKPIVRTPLCDSNCVSNINNIIFHSEKKVYPPIKVIIYKDININEVKKFMNLRIEQKVSYEGDIKITETQYFFGGMADLPSLNVNYLQGMDSIEITYNYNCGHFDETSMQNGKMIIAINCDGNKTLIFLHESKHLFCYRNTGNLEPSHQGCFLNTPIDREYGFIR